jgi:hypothetical protein
MTYSVPGQIRTHLVSSSTIAGTDSPFSRTQAVLDMMKGWEIMESGHPRHRIPAREQRNFFTD